MLESDAFAAEVRADEAWAARPGVRDVTYFVFANGATNPGAADVEEFVAVLKKKKPKTAAAPACDPAGCALP